MEYVLNVIGYISLSECGDGDNFHFETYIKQKLLD